MGLKADLPESAADARLSELLDSVRVVFAAKGFEKASMQDLAQAANMSAGNFYRYFPSKDAIIEAMVERDLAGVEHYFSLIMQSEDPLSLLRASLREQLDLDDCDGGAIWVETMAAAKRRSEIATLFGRLEATIVSYLVAVFGRIAGVDLATAEERYTAHASLIFMLVQSIKMRRRPQDGFEGSQIRALALRVIEGLLDEVAQSRNSPAKAGQTEGC